MRNIGRNFEMRALFLAAIAAVGCGSGGGLPTGPSPVMADVAFDYQATGAAEASQSSCEGVTRLYPSWWGFTHQTMIPEGGGRFVARFESVPVGRQSVRVAPPAGCEGLTLSANGVTLTAASDELVFALTVHPDGSVTP